jgi:hypothetical protein
MVRRCGVLVAMFLVVLPVGGAQTVAWRSVVAETTSAAEACRGEAAPAAAASEIATYPDWCLNGPGTSDGLTSESPQP